jgi:DNA polymerase V
VTLTPRFALPTRGYEQRLDWQRLLIQHQAATYPFEMTGEDMAPLVRPGAIVLVDRALPVLVGRLLVIEYEREFLLRRLRVVGGQQVLVAENPAVAPIAREEVTFWGMVLWVLHNHWQYP